MMMPTRSIHRYLTMGLAGVLFSAGGAYPKPQSGGFDTPAVFAAKDILPPTLVKGEPSEGTRPLPGAEAQ